MNNCQFLGRLVADPELTHPSKDSNMSIARYTLAVNRRFSKEDKADFIRIVAFNKAGEFASKYFHKGQRVLVEGRLQTSSYIDKDGKTNYTFDIIAENQEFADSPAINTSKEEVKNAIMDGFTSTTEAIDDDIPFN